MRLGRRSRGGTSTGCVEMEALSPGSTCGGVGVLRQGHLGELGYLGKGLCACVAD